MRRGRRVVDLEILERDSSRCGVALDDLAVAEQNRVADAVIEYDPRRAQNLRLLAFRKHDALGVANRTVDDPAYQSARATQAGLELLPIVLDVHELLRDAARDGGPRHGGRHPEQHPRVEG